MRPGQNRRMRGRNNNNNSGSNNNGNRKSPNPLQRSYESNGPDVKVRGTAQHVAEKYLQLARDAQSSGDPVAAENYFQHAEHYYRILLAAQEQMAQQFGHSFPPNRAFNDDGEEGEEEGDDEVQAFQPGAPQPSDQRNGEQRQGGMNGNGAPRQDGEGNDNRQQGGQRFERPDRQNNDRQNGDRNGPRRFDRGDRNDRGERRFDRAEGGQPVQGGYTPRPDAPRSDIPVGMGEQPDAIPAPAPIQGERRFERGDRPERGPRPERRPRREREPEHEAGDDVAAALPSFLTTPVRVPIAVAEEPVPIPVPAPAVAPAPVAAPVAAQPVTDAPDAQAADAAPKRPRGRRRSPREVMDALGSGSDLDNVTE